MNHQRAVVLFVMIFYWAYGIFIIYITGGCILCNSGGCGTFPYTFSWSMGYGAIGTYLLRFLRNDENYSILLSAAMSNIILSLFIFPSFFLFLVSLLPAVTLMIVLLLIRRDIPFRIKYGELVYLSMPLLLFIGTFGMLSLLLSGNMLIPYTPAFVIYTLSQALLASFMEWKRLKRRKEIPHL